MTTDSSPAAGLVHRNTLLEMDEPDDAYLLASEQQMLRSLTVVHS